MPVHAHQVPLATAKSWAKQLAKTSKTVTPDAPWPLARCQLAVAQMLGFDHWHALEQGLNLPATASPDHGPYFYQGVLPSDIQGWQTLWRDALAKAQDVHLEHRAEKTDGRVRVRMRLHGRLVHFLDMKGDVAPMAIQALFDGSKDIRFEDLLNGSILNYVSGILPMKPLESASHYRFQSLPVYPRGWDIVIRQQGKQLDTWDFAVMNLPPALEEALRRIAMRPVGLVLFTGTTGSGKSSLMQAMAKQAYSDNILSGKRAPNENRQPRHERARPLKVAVLNDPAMSRALSHARHFETGATGSFDEHSLLLPTLRSDPDLVLFGELHEAKQARGMKKLLESGVSVWASTNATGSLHSALARLDDFLPGHDWTQAEGLQAWTYTKLLPVLCRFCSQPAGRGQERALGPGCAHCNMLGVTGRQLVVGVWEMVEGQPKSLFSHGHQARALVEEGRVARKDAEDALGPLELLD